MNATKNIDEYLTDLPDWERKTLTDFRELLHKLEPKIEEAWKWDVPVFLLNGKLVCAMSKFKEHVKFNFFEGATLTDTHKLFNSGLDSKKHRSINIVTGQSIDKTKLADLITTALHQAKG